MRWLPAASRVVSAWKNGGGFTEEVAASPIGSNLETFGWRLSIASVQFDGPFSQFAGVARILAVISPGVLTLRHSNGGNAVLDERSPPYRFTGEEAIIGELHGAQVEDLNLM